MKSKILYVEDELFLGKIVKETLESKGFEVFMETNGLQALSLFTSVQPDICVIDIMLPGLDGFELVKEMRKVNQKVPIIFLTAKVQTEDVVKGFKVGGNDYMRKPFSIEELIVRVQYLLQIKNQSLILQEEEPIGPYLFQPNKQLLLRGTFVQKLSFRETELLKILLIHKNEIVQRKDVLLHIWGNDSFFNSRNLDVYIAKLRSYLKEEPGINILTIKGVGYRFIVG